MTTNQSIDGVPRKALADFIEYSVPGPYGADEKWYADKQELRALLDAPAVEHQEPVAWEYVPKRQTLALRHFCTFRPDPILGIRPDDADYQVFELYRSPPAPVAVMRMCDCNQGRMPCHEKCKPDA